MNLIAPLSICAAGLLAACASSDVGSIPDELIVLSDAAAADGTIELAVERDGEIRQMNATIPVSTLPANVREAALLKFPGAQVTGASREVHPEGDFYEVQVSQAGRAHEIVLDDEANVKTVVRAVDRKDVPQVVVDSADRAVPGGTFTGAEQIERGDETCYRIRKTRDGVAYNVLVKPDGTVERRAREARAQIEVPIKD